MAESPTCNIAKPPAQASPLLLVRPLWAILGALTLLLLWLGLLLYQNNGDAPATITSLARKAESWNLPGLAARGHLLAATCYHRRLNAHDRRSPQAQPLVRAIMQSRMAGAHLLLQAGHTAAAERLALEGARADFNDIEARALLLQTRLHGSQSDAARRELMLLVLRDEHPQALYLLGRSFAGEQRLDDAESFFRRALTVNASHFPSVLALAEIHIARRDRTGALQLVGQADALARSPKEKREVARIRQMADPSLTSRLDIPLFWWSQHSGSVLVAALYLLFLLSPLWLRLLPRKP